MSIELLEQIKSNSKWNDQFPSTLEWRAEVGRWLQYINERGQYDRYINRLQDNADKRDEALAEIQAGFYLEKKLGLEIVEWEPDGEGGKKGEYLVALPDKTNVFCEVKCPSWKRDIAIKDHKSPRLKGLKRSSPLVSGQK